MNDNFSQRVKDVIAYSKEEAIRLGHNNIGTEHLVLGILRDGKGKAVRLLKSLDVDLSAVRAKIESIAPPKEVLDDTPKNLQLTKQAERALKTTFLEARLQKSNSVDTVHLLLCILKNEDDPIAQLMSKFNVDYDTLKVIVKAPLEITDNLDKYDVFVNVHGGGYTGQAGAIRHGISRALLKADSETRPVLKQAGFLTRDPRMVERKKYGLKKARRAPQFSKR